MNISNIFELRKPIGFWLGIIFFAIFIIFPISEINYSASMMFAVAVIMVIWWISEAIPLGATSLLPIVAMPLLGIIAGNDVAREYFNSTILIFLGGFLIALAMQKSLLHKRISLLIIKILGRSNSGIILGFMSSAAILSMFISNVATTVMLLPIGLAFIYQMEEKFGTSAVHPIATSIMLGIAYSSSIGGIATLIGTAPNLIFQRVFQLSFPELEPITFANWLLFGLPISLIMLLATWKLLTSYLFVAKNNFTIEKNFIKEELESLGKITYDEKVVLAIFSATVFLWLFRQPIDLEVLKIPGWGLLFASNSMIDDSTVAIFAGLLLFIIPAKKKSTSGENKLLNMDILSKIPWEVILIFGGGFALAKGFADSGLSLLIGDQFGNINGTNPLFMVVTISTSITFLTELTSNTATTNALLPILASIAKANGINPLILMLPATISASFAFMLPVGTPPNAIVYGSGKIKLQEMMKAGIYLNLLGIVIVSLYFYIVSNLFGFM